MKVVGIEKNVIIDFDDRKKNEHVHHEGVRLHLGEEITKDGEGIRVSSIFVSNKRDFFTICESMKVGDKVRCSYNRFGSLDYIDIVK